MDTHTATGTENAGIFVTAVGDTGEALGQTSDLEIVLSDDHRHAEGAAGLPLTFGAVAGEEPYRLSDQFVADLSALASTGIRCWQRFLLLFHEFDVFGDDETGLFTLGLPPALV
jgi:hypothetical protein